MSTLDGIVTTFKKALTKFTTDTRGHADDFNAVHQDLINNDVILDDRMTKQELAIEKALKFDQTEVNVIHNLGSYPLARVMSDVGYGHGGFGEFVESSKMQLPCKLEYVNSNEVRLHLDEKFQGNPTVTSIDANNFNISFSSEDTIIEVKFI